MDYIKATKRASIKVYDINHANKVRLWAAEAAKKFRHKPNKRPRTRPSFIPLLLCLYGPKTVDAP